MNQTFELLPNHIPLMADAFAPFDADANFIYDRATFDGRTIKLPKHAVDARYFGNTAFFSHRRTDNHGNTFFLINVHSEKTGETITFNTKTAHFQLKDKGNYTPKIDRSALERREAKAKQAAQQERQKSDYLQRQFEQWLQQLNAAPMGSRLVESHPYIIEKFGSYATLATTRDSDLRHAKDERGDCLIIGLVQEVGGAASCIQKIYDRNIGKPNESPRNKDFRGIKKGAFHVIGNLRHAHKGLYFVEGYATGLTVALATGLPVVVCLDAGNLPIVAKKFSDWGYKNINICPDNDIKADKENTGLIAAFKAVKGVPLANVLVPQNDGIKCDFNDVFIAKGLDEVKRQLHNSHALTFENGGLYVNKRKNKSSLERAEYERAYLAFISQVLPEQRESNRAKIINSLLDNCPRHYSLETACFKAEKILIHERDKEALRHEIMQAYQAKKARIKARHSLTDADLQGITRLDISNSTDFIRLGHIAKNENAIIIDARPMGSGKTELIGELIEHLGGISSLVIAPRVSLTHDAAARLGTAHYQSEGRAKFTAQKLTTTPNSMLQFNPSKEFQHGFFDEMRLNLEGILDGATMENSRAIFEELKAFIQANRLSVFCDADLNALTLDFIRNAAPDKKIYYLYDSQPRKHKLPLLTYKGTQLDVIRHEAVKLFENNKNGFIPTDSITEAEKTANYLKSHGVKEDDIYLVTSKTVNSERNKKLLANPNEESKKCRFLIATPALQTGVSICNGHFDAVLGLFGSGTCTSNEIAQSLCRVRDAKEIIIAISPQKNRNRAISLQLFLDGEANVRHEIGYDGNLTVEMDEFAQRHYRALKQRNEDLNDLENSILLHLENIGFEVTHNIIESEKVEKIKGLSAEVKAEQAKEILKADSITSADFSALMKNKNNRTPEQHTICDRHLVEDMAGLTAHNQEQLEKLHALRDNNNDPVTEKTVDDFQKGTLARIYKRELMTADIDELKDEAGENINKGKLKSKWTDRRLIDDLLDAIKRHGTDKTFTDSKTGNVKASSNTAFDYSTASKICDEVLIANAAELSKNGYADYNKKTIERPVSTLRNMFKQFGYTIVSIGRDGGGKRSRWFEVIEDATVTEYVKARAENRKLKPVL